MGNGKAVKASIWMIGAILSMIFGIILAVLGAYDWIMFTLGALGASFDWVTMVLALIYTVAAVGLLLLAWYCYKAMK